MKTFEINKVCEVCNGDGWIYHSRGGQSGLTKDCSKCKKLKDIKHYALQTIIEPYNDEYRVVGQDCSLPVPLFYGSYIECINWRNKNFKPIPKHNEKRN